MKSFLWIGIPERVSSIPLFSIVAPLAVKTSEPVEGATSKLKITSRLVALYMVVLSPKRPPMISISNPYSYSDLISGRIAAFPKRESDT